VSCRHFVPVAPELDVAMSKHHVQRNPECPNLQPSCRVIGMARAMDFQKRFLQQIARARIVTHSRANEASQARGERAIQRLERREAPRWYSHMRLSSTSVSLGSDMGTAKKILQ
jgi:hypothetical protein